MSQLILIMHILGAVATLAYIAVGLILITMRKGNAQASKRAAIVLGAVQILSGLGLIMVYPGVSVKNVCVQGLLGLGAIVLVHSTLAFRLKPTQ